MSSVLLVCTDRIGERMAGVGVRYVELAHVLRSAGHGVTVAAPTGSERPEADWELVVYAPGDARQLSEVVAGADAVVSPVLPAAVVQRARPSVARWIFDLYDPEPLESLELLTERPRLEAGLRHRLLLDRVTAALRAGDAFVCASERQRDLWLGALMAAGRLTQEAHEADPSGRALIDVVPFGLPRDPPIPVPGVGMRGRWAGIGSDDEIVLWAGGIWDWLDPITAIEAIDLLRRDRPGVRLVFLGAGRPGGQSTMPAEERARKRVDGLGLRTSHVVFNNGWVPYEQRGTYLLEADVGVSTHLDHVEGRYSFRTRILDHVWAGLPTVATGGDSMSEIVEAAGAGLTVGYRNAAGLAAALDQVLARGRASYADRFPALRERFAWQIAAAPLVRLLETRGGAHRPGGLARYALLDGFVGRLVRLARR
jgi:glycosyltransferase involved in cell wall biosynthesis